MTGFEYKVVPAPMRGLKGKGIKGTPARFANALQSVMNDLGGDGWEYQRTDTLPVEERVGLTGKTTSFQNMLVFRRVIKVAVEETPDVAALIEDQNKALKAAPKVDEVIEYMASATETVARTTETSIAEADDVPEEAAMTFDANDRVSETLNAPFAFPWNRRRKPEVTLKR